MSPANAKALFNSDTLTIRSDLIEKAKRDYSIDFIADASFKGIFSFTQSINPSSMDVKIPNITNFTTKAVSSDTSAIIIIEANTDVDGTIYCVADRH